MEPSPKVVADIAFTEVLAAMLFLTLGFRISNFISSSSFQTFRRGGSYGQPEITVPADVVPQRGSAGALRRRRVP